jgi:hypothetical protein
MYKVKKILGHTCLKLDENAVNTTLTLYEKHMGYLVLYRGVIALGGTALYIYIYTHTHTHTYVVCVHAHAHRVWMNHKYMLCHVLGAAARNYLYLCSWLYLLCDIRILILVFHSLMKSTHDVPRMDTILHESFKSSIISFISTEICLYNILTNYFNVFHFMYLVE